MKPLFWLLFGALVYTYAGYSLLIWVWGRFMGLRRPRPPLAPGQLNPPLPLGSKHPLSLGSNPPPLAGQGGDMGTREHELHRLPTVSLLIAAYNEEKSILAKLENAKALEYPPELLEIVVVSDGSTDGTNRLVKGVDGVRLIAWEGNLGKAEALSRSVPLTRGEIIIFSDATGMWNPGAIKAMARHFEDPAVGCVAGEVVYVDPGTAVASGQGLYWRYEVWHRRALSLIGGLTVVSGSIHAVRRKLFAPSPSEVGLDMVVPLRTLGEGYRVVYEPEALSHEEPSPTLRAEFSARVRVVTRAFREIQALARFLNPLVYGWTSFHWFSHKILRWLAAPLLLLLLLVSVLLFEDPLYRWMLWGQLAFYGLGAIGFLLARLGRSAGLLAVPFYFLLMNVTALIGLARYLMGHRIKSWQPVRGS